MVQKLLYTLTTLSVLISCKSTVAVDNTCNENRVFKERFFYHIGNIEKNITTRQDSTFIKSVIFVSNYALVSTNDIMNYAMSYPMGVFERDHIKWMEWYEANKCTNLQLKERYIVPDVYQDVFLSKYIRIAN